MSGVSKSEKRLKLSTFLFISVKAEYLNGMNEVSKWVSTEREKV